MCDYQSAFHALTADPRYQRNLDWGEPRPGHPEGTIRAHIAELEQNLERLRPRLNEEDCWKLKLLIHAHDTFKAEAETHVPIVYPTSHASLARSFLAGYCEDADLLAMVQYHDEPFALYQQVKAKRKYSRDRFAALLHAIQDWNLFLAFLIVDGSTRGKSRKPLHWFFRKVGTRVQSVFTEEDIIA